jgi:2-methylcitrate dehydratase PrpD
MGAAVEAKLRQGKTLRAEIPYGPGHTQNPVGETEIVKKFHALVDDVVGEEKARRAADMILHLDELGNAGALMETLAAPSRVQ